VFLFNHPFDALHKQAENSSI